MPLAKYEQLIDRLKLGKRPVVALSGGVDSSFLLMAALEAWGDSAGAIFAQSKLLKSLDIENVKTVASALGARLTVLEIDPFGWSGFASNPPGRCYFCKKKIYSLFISCLNMHNNSCLMDGTNADDLLSERPGLVAIRELGVETPLADVGLTKQEIRQIARQKGLAVWNRPSASCLATRLSTGCEITVELLVLIDTIEEFLNSLGFAGCRAKLEADKKGVRLELVKGDIERILIPELRQKVVDYLKTLGLSKVFLDLSEREGILF